MTWQGDPYFQGDISELHVFDYALSDHEVIIVRTLVRTLVRTTSSHSNLLVPNLLRSPHSAARISSPQVGLCAAQRSLPASARGRTILSLADSWLEVQVAVAHQPMTPLSPCAPALAARPPAAFQWPRGTSKAPSDVTPFASSTGVQTGVCPLGGGGGLDFKPHVSCELGGGGGLLDSGGACGGRGCGGVGRCSDAGGDAAPLHYHVELNDARSAGALRQLHSALDQHERQACPGVQPAPRHSSGRAL